MARRARGALRGTWLVACLTAAGIAVAGWGTGSALAASGPVRWAAPKLVDTAPPVSAPDQLSGVSCPTADACVAVGPNGTIVTTDGTTRTVVNGVDGGATFGWISCPSSSLCVITEAQSLLVSTDPLAATPTWTHVAMALGTDEFDGVTCASASLCLTWEDSSVVRVSTDPAGGASTWTATTLPGGSGRFVYSAVCAPDSTDCTVSLGNAKNSHGGFATSTDPAGGASTWTLTTAATAEFDDGLDAMTCASATLCVGVANGSIATSTNLSGGVSTWTVGQVVDPMKQDFDGVACAPATTTCVGVLSDGAVAASNTAASGYVGYTISGVLDPAGYGTANVNGIACASATLCLAPDTAPGLAVITPGPPATSRDLTGFGGTTSITALDCLSATLCLGVDDGGGILRTTSPAGGASAWHRTVQTAAAGHGLQAIDCLSTRFCVATGADDTVEITTHPATASRWTATRLPFKIEAGSGPYVDDLDAVSCPSTKLCVIGNGEYGIITTTDPTGGPKAYHVRPVGAFDADTWNAVDCPSTTLCVAGDDSFGRIAVTTHPGAPKPDWRMLKIARGVGSLAPGFDTISCPSVTLCVAGASNGSVFWSTDPAGGASAWHGIRLARHAIASVQCRSATLCLATDGHQTVYATTHPTGPVSAWHATTLATGTFPIAAAPAESLQALACAPTKLCLAATGIGAVFAGRTTS